MREGETEKGGRAFSLRLVKEVSLRLAEESGSQCRSGVGILDYLQEFVTANVSKLRS
jgi:hypothetical protein